MTERFRTTLPVLALLLVLGCTGAHKEGPSATDSPRSAQTRTTGDEQLTAGEPVDMDRKVSAEDFKRVEEVEHTGTGESQETRPECSVEGSVTAEDDVRQTTLEIVALQFGVAEQRVQSDAPLSGPPTGADELDIVELIMELEEEFDVILEDGKLDARHADWTRLTANDFVALIREQLGEDRPGKGMPVAATGVSQSPGSEEQERDSQGPSFRHLKVSKEGEINVARFVDEKILDETLVQGLGQELLGLAESDNPPKLVLDFSSVKFLSEAALGKLIILHKKIKEQAGQLKLANLCPEIEEVFVITRLNKLFDIYDDEADALADF
jgi:anti-sigma B factor antagonist